MELTDSFIVAYCDVPTTIKAFAKRHKMDRANMYRRFTALKDKGLLKIVARVASGGRPSDVYMNVGTAHTYKKGSINEFW